MEEIINNPQNATISQSNGSENEDGFSLREFLEILIGNWPWFLLSAFLFVVAASLYLATKPNIYQQQAVMLVKESNGSSGGRRNIGNDALMQLNGVVAGSSVKNELYILRSHQLMKEVARKLNLDVMYSYRVRLQNVSLYTDRPFTVRFHPEDSVLVSGFKVRILNAKECRIYQMQTADADLEYEKVVRFGKDMLDTPIGRFSIEVEPSNIDNFIGENISVVRVNNEMAANMIGGSISTSEMDKMSSLVSITCTDTNVARADSILSALLEAYAQSIIDDKNKLAQSTADFIDERIKLISRELSEVEGDIASFKQNNNLIDVSSNAHAYFTEYTTARKHTIELQAQKAAVEFLLQHLRSKSEGNTLIPVVNITDGGSQAMISEYNKMMLERNRLVETAGVNSTMVKDLDSNLAQLKQATIASVQAYLASIDVQIKHSLTEEEKIQRTLSTVPQKEMQMLDITRQQVIKETLYTYLLNKREETALQLAISEANIRVVEQPFGSTAPIAPRKKMIILAAGLIGFAFPYGIFFMINMLNVSVRGRKEIEMFTTIPVIGDIPHIKGDFNENGIVVNEKANDSVNEAFRMLRFNLGFVKKDARVIMFTSTMPSEGKTFISRNFAFALALMGKRVLLMDTDIRKRTQSASLAAQKKEGLTSYLNGSVDDPMELIGKGAGFGSTTSSNANVDFLPAGLVPPNPAELLMSHRLDELMEKLKAVYDYIVVDNVPAQMVADAAIVNRVADLTIYVVRARKLDRRFLPELERLYQEKKFKNLTILINDAELEKKRYGYGHYTYYGYYGYYGYSYGYGYGNKGGKKRRFSFKW